VRAAAATSVSFDTSQRTGWHDNLGEDIARSAQRDEPGEEVGPDGDHQECGSCDETFGHRIPEHRPSELSTEERDQKGDRRPDGASLGRSKDSAEEPPEDRKPQDENREDAGKRGKTLT
jgi:hypothetical protein